MKVIAVCKKEIRVKAGGVKIAGVYRRKEEVITDLYK